MVDAAYDLNRYQQKTFSYITKINTKEAKLTFDDVLLLPQYSTVVSRKYVDLEQQLDSKNNLRIPIISSPMDTVPRYCARPSYFDGACIKVVER